MGGDIVSLEELSRRAASCTACVLSATRRRVVFGTGTPHAPLMIVGEGPGVEEDAKGLPFVGRSGALLGTLLDEVGHDRSAIYVTNTVKCRPPENRNPRAGEMAACRPFLHGQLEQVDPKVVVTLGNVATRALLGTTATITSLRGQRRVSPHTSAIVIPTFHPAAGLRGGERVVAMIRADLALAAAVLTESGR